jgi:hypothetical protein
LCCVYVARPDVDNTLLRMRQPSDHYNFVISEIYNCQVSCLYTFFEEECIQNFHTLKSFPCSQSVCVNDDDRLGKLAAMLTALMYIQEVPGLSVGKDS